MNTVKCNWDVKNKSKTAELILEQGVALEKHSTLRYHKMNVGFYSENGQLIEIKEIILQNQKETVVKYDGSKQVAMIIPNVGDLTFIKVLLDEQSLSVIMSNLHNIEDELTRSIVWRSLFEMVRD